MSTYIFAQPGTDAVESVSFLRELSCAAVIAVVLVALVLLCCRLVSRLTASHDERLAAGAALYSCSRKLLHLPAECAAQPVDCRIPHRLPYMRTQKHMRALTSCL